MEKMKTLTTKIISPFLFVLFFILPQIFAAEYIQAKVAIHMSSTVSDGSQTIEEIARACENETIDAVIFTDRFAMNWEYGLKPWPRILKKTIKRNSVLLYGIDKYLNDINAVKKKYPNIVFIAGVESAPFYYWSGSPFKDNLTLHNWHRHMLALGLKDTDDYYKLPVIGNTRALRQGFDIKKLWPFFLVSLGVFIIAKKNLPLKGKNVLNAYKKIIKADFIPLALIGIGILTVINNWPFKKILYDQYHGDLGAMPYQNYIDYVNSKGGVVFWAHPEAQYFSSRGKVAVETNQYPELLFKTSGYSGFTIFYEGYKKVGLPGGIWDNLLKEYTTGERNMPVWAIASMAYDMSGTFSNRLRSLQTVVLVKEKNEQSIMDALKKGRIYASKGNNCVNFTLSSFYISDLKGGNIAITGDTAKINGAPVIHIAAEYAQAEKEVKVKLIRNGEIINTFELKTPFKVSYTDSSLKEDKAYYRLEIEGKDLLFITNPIFFLKKSFFTL
ncbi:MAG: hypothetical protein ABH872_05990 [Candidatus Omnitrophota bacterium]